MHPAAYRWVAGTAAGLGPFRSVIEAGSRDMNGSVRPLFPGADYVGVDIEAGPGVDVVADALRWQPDRRAGAVVCVEVLEHLAEWAGLLANMRLWLEPGGTLILTCAGPGRRPHSGIDGRRRLHPGEWYRNVDPDDLARVLRRAGYVDVDVDVFGSDVRATARRAAIPTIVGVPFRDEWQRTRRLVNQLVADPAVDRVLLADNGSTDPATLSWMRRLIDPKLTVEHRPPLGAGRSLYAVWNDHVRTALAESAGPVNVALLNNDLMVPAGLAGHLAHALRTAPAHVAAVYPDWSRPLSAGVGIRGLTETTGTWRHGGLSGFCFMFRGELLRDETIPWFDERYEWVFGDGDFVEGLELAGYTAARVDGLPLEHDRSATARQTSWVGGAKRRDVERRKQKVADRDRVAS